MNSQTEFTDEEKYLIAYFRSTKASGPSRSLSFYVGIIIAALVFESIGFATRDIVVAAIAFLMLLYITVWTAITAWKRTPVYRSILEKYENRLLELASKTESKPGA